MGGIYEGDSRIFLMVLKPKAPEQLSLFPDLELHGRAPEEPKLMELPVGGRIRQFSPESEEGRRLVPPDKAKVYRSFFVLGDRVFGVKATEPRFDSIEHAGLFQLAGGGDVQIGYGDLGVPSEMDRGYFGYHADPKDAGRKTALINYGLSDEYKEAYRGRGMGTMLVDMVVAAAGRHGVGVLYGEVQYEEDTRHKDRDGESSAGILKRAGFDHYATTHKGELYRKRL
jgi:hypothetical protein